jgi:hypothetical protein
MIPLEALTSISTVQSSRCARTSMRPPSGVSFTALESRFRPSDR